MIPDTKSVDYLLNVATSNMSLGTCRKLVKATLSKSEFSAIISPYKETLAFVLIADVSNARKQKKYPKCERFSTKN